MPPAKVEPGRDPEMSARTKKLNVVFALTSIGLLAAFSLMVWADYDREWKKYQLEFNKLEVKLTREQRDAALGKVDAAKAKALEEQIALGEKQIAARRATRQVPGRGRPLKGVWYRVDQDFRFTKAKIDVARYDYEEALHKGEKSAEAKKKRLDDLEASWRQFRLDKEKVEADQAAANAKLATIAGTATSAQNRPSFGREDVLTCGSAIDWAGSYVRNSPIIDMRTPGEVNQIITTEPRDDVTSRARPRWTAARPHLHRKKGYETAPPPTHQTSAHVGPHASRRWVCCHTWRATSLGRGPHAHPRAGKGQGQ
jgi:hypothetical protein